MVDRLWADGIVGGTTAERRATRPLLSTITINADDLAAHYRAFIALINAHTLSADDLAPFIHEPFTLNNTSLSRHDIGTMLLGALGDPAGTLSIDQLVVHGDTVAARLVFDRRAPDGTITPGLPFAGKLAMAEPVFYRFAHGQIAEASSVIETVEAAQP